MIALALVAASRAGFSPEGWSEVWLASGYVLDHPAVGFGGGTTWRAGPVRIGGSGSVGARAIHVVDDFPSESPYGLGTVWAGLTSPNVGFVAIADAALLAAEEEDCQRNGDCRHELWVGTADWGISAQPAAGLLFHGQGMSGGRWSLVAGLQPHARYGEDLFFCPRVDFVAAVSTHTTFHLWAGRYGVAIEVGRRLGGN